MCWDVVGLEAVGGLDLCVTQPRRNAHRAIPRVHSPLVFSHDVTRLEAAHQ